MAGAVIIVIVMVLVGPMLLFLGGAVWSALVGTFMVHDAEQRAEGTEYLDQHLW